MDERTRPRVRAAAVAYDEAGRTVPWLTRTVHRLYNVLAQKILDREGITIAHWFYLRVLAERGALNQLELSKRVGMASATAVTALDSLEKRGLVQRTRDQNDRRKYFVSLTDEGRRLIDVLMPDIEQTFMASLEGIEPQEMAVFWKVLHQINDNLQRAAGQDAVLD